MVGRIPDQDNTLACIFDVNAHMAWCMTGGVECGDTRCDRIARLDEAEFFSKRFHIALDEFGSPFCPAAEALFRRPEIIFGSIGYINRIRIGWLATFHQAANVVRVHVGDHHMGDIFRLNADELHIGNEVPGIRTPVGAVAIT